MIICYLHSYLHPTGLRADWLPGSNQSFPENVGLSRSLFANPILLLHFPWRAQEQFHLSLFLLNSPTLVQCIICCQLSPIAVAWLGCGQNAQIHARMLCLIQRQLQGCVSTTMSQAAAANLYELLFQIPDSAGLQQPEVLKVPLVRAILPRAGGSQTQKSGRISGFLQAALKLQVWHIFSARLCPVFVLLLGALR